MKENRTISWFKRLVQGLLVISLVACGTNANPPSQDGDNLLKVSNAGATSNTTVVVTFSKPVQGGEGSAENPVHYSITSESSKSSLTSQAVVGVKEAVLSEDKTSVTLTTFPQSQIKYTLVVTEVKDLAGNQIAPKDRLTGETNTAQFVGVPESGNPTDTDGDGISDAAEQLGWLVVIEKGAGESKTIIERREVTSDPTKKDTDGDGLTDSEERSIGIDPRTNDSDGDKLSDYLEWNHIYSSPTNQDTDGDDLNDESEWNFYRTNPTLADTDGDQISDDKEVILDNRNPRAADIPVPNIKVGQVNLTLDVRFDRTNSTGTVESANKSVSSSLTQTSGEQFSQTDSNTNEFLAKVGVSTTWEVGFFKASASAKFSAETSTTNSWSSSFTKESSQETQQTYAESFDSGLQQSVDESIQRTVEGGKMQVVIDLKNVSDVAFSLSNIEVTAFVQNQQDVSSLKPVATLLPKGATSFNFGPNETKSALIFESSEVFPSVIEDLMKNPRGLTFKVANYDVTDESNRNFAFTSQDINDRTSPVIIDYGGFDSDKDGLGDDSERLRVSTSAGRAIEDMNGDGVIDDNDRILFRLDKTQVGITLQEVLEGIMGLKHYDETTTPSASLAPAELRNSYATKVIDIDGQQVQTLWRIRQAINDETTQLKRWVVIDSEGIDPNLDFNSRVLYTAQGITLAYAEDKDKDRITARWEYLFGCSDELKDSDEDGISDFEEVYQGWEVSIAGRGSYKAFSSCNTEDSDLDGLTDAEEKTLGTDALKRDSDEDGLDDFTEVSGLTFDYILGGQKTVVTDPLNADTDGDSAPDGLEVAKGFGSDPTVKDADLIKDTDKDGLSDHIEKNVGWTVATEAVSKTAGVAGAKSSVAVFSNYLIADEDDDGLMDGEEYSKKTHPNKADSDGDGLEDSDPNDPNPLDADTDNDQLSDGAETVGCHSYPASDPKKFDTDGDLLSDGRECISEKTNPRKVDTDEDSYTDYEEIILRDLYPTTEPQFRMNPLIKDQLLRVGYTRFDVIGSCENGVDGQSAEAGDGEFTGLLKLKRPNGVEEELYDVYNAYIAAQTNNGEGLALPATAIATVKLTVGDAGFTLFSTLIQEQDTGGSANLGAMSPITKTYGEITSNSNPVIDVPGNNAPDGCKVKISTQIKIVKVPGDL